MADNVKVVAATGGGDPPIATDDVSGVHFQKVKLDGGGDGVSAPITGDTGNGLDVDVTRVQGTVNVAFTRPSLGTVTTVAASASSVTLKALNGSRLGLLVYNDSTANLYLKLGATASTTSFTVKVAAAAVYELPAPVYTGVVDGVWDSATGNARVTELT